MKFSDWKTKAQAQFRPARHVHAPVSNVPHAFTAEVVAIEGDAAYRRGVLNTAIAHSISTLAISNPQQYVGKEVEISYPCGNVGLLLQVDALALEAAALQKADAEKTASVLER
ncbi:hypothetical protein RA224_09355 [Achromobacter aegrifaciens]|uniref:hypothetical protein n=1 Tax=Achromobacter aegrifaciens TaxID=1287736 RepID=UPI0027B9FBC4|nr:hypothetical protein [Achromobacter aegrifaciens]WLW63608.1 hypothetical protein RA224_09355 [Achromobacter aegrifaciens]